MKDKKKILSVILLNTVIFAGIILAVEFIIYERVLRDYKNHYGELVSDFPPPKFFQSYFTEYRPSVYQFYKKKRDLWIRPFSLDENNVKPPVLLFGCSFTHGSNYLEDEQTFGAKLSKLAKRNVYNFGICSAGIQHMLYLIQHRIDEYIDHNNLPEYAIYTYIPNHLQRLRLNIVFTMFFNGTNLQYKIKGSELVLDRKHFDFLHNLFIVKSVYSTLDRIQEKDILKDKYLNFMIANEIFLESRKELEKKYPGIKFIILRYQVENDDSEREMPFMWDVLKSEGFEIVNSEDLIGRKFKYHSEDTVKDGFHPSEQAWDLLIPELIKKFDM